MRKGFTIIELLITMVISSVLLLTLGGIARIALSSHDRLWQEAKVVNDTAYCLDLLRHSLRGARNVTLDAGNGILTADNLIFKIDGSDLVFIDTDNSNQRNVILKDADSLAFSPVYVSAGYYRIDLSGEKNNFNFDYSINIQRRNL